MPFSLWTGLDGLVMMLRFHSVFHCLVRVYNGETEDLAAKTGQSNLYFVQQIVANLESIFLLDVV